MRGDPCNPNPLATTAGTGFNVDGCTRDSQRAGQESDDFFVGGTIDRRGRNTDFECVAMHADALRSGGFGLDQDREDRSVLRRLHDPLIHR